MDFPMDAIGPGAANFMSGLEQALTFTQRGRHLKQQTEALKQQMELAKAHQKIYDAQAQQLQQNAQMGVQLQQLMTGTPEQGGQGPAGVDVYPGKPPDLQAAMGLAARMNPGAFTKAAAGAMFPKPEQPHAIGTQGLWVPGVGIVGAPQPTSQGTPTEEPAQGMQWLKGINAKGQPTWHQGQVPKPEPTPQLTQPETAPAAGYQWAQGVNEKGNPTWHQVPVMKENANQTEEQLIARSLKGDAEATAILKELQTRKIEQAKASGEGRAGAWADIRTVNMLDTAQGNKPVTITVRQLTANPDRYISTAGGAKALNQTVLIEDIRGAITLTRDSLRNLKTEFTPLQASQLSIALNAPVNSGALDAFFASGVGRSLTPEQIDYITNLAQLKENAMAMRSVLGAGQGSDELRAAISATLPSPRTPTRAYAEQALNKFEGQINRLERGIPTVPLRPERAGPGAEAPKPSAEETKTLGGKTYIKRGGKWYEQ